MGYAKKNLRDVQDMAVQFGFSKAQEARFPRQDLGAEQTGMNYLIIKPANARRSPIATARQRRSTSSSRARGA